jgi:uncharacterized damage-inducible protein DinB
MPKRKDERDILEIPAGYRSREVASFVAQLDDQTRLMMGALRRIRPPELAWQARPGQNTIGMLLAHIAVVEVFWVQVGPLERKRFDTKGPIGIGIDDDGMPLPAGAGPPSTLAGKGLPFYEKLMANARRQTVRHARDLTDADLERVVTRTRRDGSRDTFNIRWVLYHMLEHLAGHHGQILLLRHLYSDSRART